MSSLITQEDKLVLTQAELDYLQTFLDVNDRGGYYLALYNMTGNAEVMVEAQVSMFSEGAGGAAYLANQMLRDNFPNRYMPNIPDDDAAIYFISQEVAKSNLRSTKQEIADGGTGELTDEQVLDSALVE